MKLTNQQIYNHAQNINRVFTDMKVYLPVKVNFFLQKNSQLLLKLAQEIEEARLEIFKQYGELNADKTQYVIPPEKISIASQEIEDLFSIEQEVDIVKFSIEKFSDNIELSLEQMNAIMFMIEEA